MTKIRVVRHGFFSVELLVVLFIAAAFVVSGYQLYSSVMAASINGKSDIAASNLASDYMERFRYRAGTPCVEKTVINNLAVKSDFLRDARVTVKITCPITGVSSFLKNGVSSKIESSVVYDGGRKTSSSKIVNNKITIKQVSTGYNSVVALGSDGQVYTWGSNRFGQLGNGLDGAGSNLVNNSTRPVEVMSSSSVMAGKRIKEVSAGGYHVLALSEDGKVYSWGYNYYGQLGDSSTINRKTPVEVNFSGVLGTGQYIESIAASYSSSAAVSNTGMVYTWGENSKGQLGTGTITNSVKPIAVKTSGTPMAGKVIKKISAGWYFFLALGSDQNVYSWGDNTYTQLGVNQTSAALPYSSVPLAVIKTSPSSMIGKPVKDISAGGFHSMVLATDGTAHAWGLGYSGQLGQNNSTSYSYPVKVSTVAPSSLFGKTISSVIAGQESSYAIDSEGKISAWGRNAEGALATGDNTIYRVPTLIKTIGTAADGINFSQLSARILLTALDSSGAVYTSGANDAGQLGNGSLENTNTLSQVQNGAVIKNLSSGYYHTIALMSDGNMFGWGRNSSGNSVGNGSSANVLFPVQLSVVGSSVIGKKITQVATGGYHSIALDSEGGLHGWGLNTSGQLGDGTKTSRNKPVSINLTGTPLEGKVITQLAASEFNSLALTSEGQVYAWGRGTDGMLGNGTIVDVASPRPTLVDVTGTPMNGKNIVQIALGYGGAYALDDSGTVYSWGCANSGALGNGTTSSGSTTTTCAAGTYAKPVAVAVTGTPMSGKNIREIGAGHTFAIARTADGETFSWGSNTNGRLGGVTAAGKFDGMATPYCTTSLCTKPVQIAASLQKLTVGYTSAAGVGMDGFMYSWGANNYYQQANGGTGNVMTPTPRVKLSDSPIEQISAGAYNFMLLDYNKNIFGWGYNGYGDLGILNNTTPQQVPRPLTRIQYNNAW